MTRFATLACLSLLACSAPAGVPATPRPDTGVRAGAAALPITPLPTPKPERLDDVRPEDFVADNGLACPPETRPLRRTIEEPMADDPPKALRDQVACLLDDHTLHGPYRRSILGGHLVDVGEYDHGLRIGTWKTGMGKEGFGTETPYLHGLKQGLERRFWFTGQVAVDAHYVGGKLHGHYRQWNLGEGVTVAVEGDFVDDRYDGTWTYTDQWLAGPAIEKWEHGERISRQRPGKPIELGPEP